MGRETASGQFGRYSTRTRRVFLQALGAAGLGIAASKGVTASTESPTRIDSCTTITEPGEYALVGDVSPVAVDRVGCIEIEANDVTLRGEGHTIDGHDTEDVPFGIAVNPRSPQGGEMLENVTVENVAVTGFSTGIDYRNAAEGRITRVTATNGGAGIALSEDTRGMELERNRSTDCDRGLVISGDPDIGTGTSGARIRHSDFEANSLGIHVGHEAVDNGFERNRIVGNGNGVFQTVFAVENGFHHNAICANEAYGYQNVDAFLVDVIGEGDPADRIEAGVLSTENYWGAANGPSSFGNPAEPLVDPETGRPADGDGDAISESLDEGVSNVRFDPFLESIPADVGTAT